MLSKDTTLEYKTSLDSEYVLATGLLSVPPLAGEKDQIEVTDLSDSYKRYINGLKDAGDVSMQFIYDNSADSPYRKLRAAGEEDETVDFKITLPDGTIFEFEGMPNVTIDEVTVNERITFTVKVALASDIEVTDPVY